jgi:hypothetical protein
VENGLSEVKLDNPIGFRLDLDSTEEFFRRCIARKADTIEERMMILNELVYELRALKLNEEDLKKLTKGKKIMHVKKGK